MRTSADYRELAGHCVRLAQAASAPEHRGLLLNIAHTSPTVRRLTGTGARVTSKRQ
jgi:hypothetical protein